MSFELVLLGVLGGVTLLLLLAYRTQLPYPIMLVLGGGVLGFLPGLPDVEVEPEVVLVLFLPLLLYSAAFFSSVRDLRENARPIGLLAIGLVVLTTLGVGTVAHLVIPGLSWAAAFTLGAIVAPTDPVAATAIASRSGAPRRFVAVVEGEALVNDATALIAYKVALTAVTAGTFSLLDAGVEFVLDAALGVAIGIAVGALVAPVRRMLDDAPTEITISLLTPFFAYLPAEELGVSAVLAAVTAGVYLGWRAPQLLNPGTRIQLYAVWELLTFLLNAAVFALLGLQLHRIATSVGDEYGVAELAGYSAAVAGAVVLIRLLWIFPATYLPRWIWPGLRERDPIPPVGLTVLIGFTGMRGAVSLAVALSLPEAFPARDLVLFLVYVVILVTLVVQGLLLSPLIGLLGVHDDGKLDRLETKARIKAAKAAIARVDDLVGEDWVRDDTAERVRGLQEFRIRRFKARLDEEDDGAIDQRSVNFQHLQRAVLEAQRTEIIRLRDEGFINDAVLRRIEHDLDLEDQRLDLPAGEGAPRPAALAEG